MFHHSSLFEFNMVTKKIIHLLPAQPHLNLQHEKIMVLYHASH